MVPQLVVAESINLPAGVILGGHFLFNMWNSLRSPSWDSDVIRRCARIDDDDLLGGCGYGPAAVAEPALRSNPLVTLLAAWNVPARAHVKDAARGLAEKFCDVLDAAQEVAGERALRCWCRRIVHER